MRVEDSGGVIWHGQARRGRECVGELRRLLRRARRRERAGGDRPLHRAVQAGSQHVSAAREGSEEEGRVMRTCQSCGAENPPDRDFCSCGEYLRWEPTGFVQAITPEMAAEAAAQAAPPQRRPSRPRPAAPAAATPPPAAAPAAAAAAHVTPAAPVQPESGNGHGNGHAQPAAPPPPPPAPPHALVAARDRGPAVRADARARRSHKTLVRGAVPPPAAPAPAAAPEQAEPAHDRAAAARRRPGQGRGRCTRPSSRASASACSRSSATRAGSSTTTTCASKACPTTGGRSSPAPSTWCRSAPAARTSRRSRSTCIRRAAPRPRRACGT